MQKTLIAFAAALLVAAGAASDAAMAGGCGKGFGGYSSRQSYRPSYAQQQRRLAQQRAALRQRQLARIQAEKRREALAEAKARKAKLAAIAEAKERAAKVALAQKAKEASKERAAKVAQAAKAQEAKEERAKLAQVEAAKPEDAEGKSEIAVTTAEPAKVAALAPVNSAPEMVVQEQPASVPASTETQSAEKGLDAKLACKRYIASAGLTVSVPCED